MKNNKQVILCIDDDDDMLNVLKVILEKNGFAVECAGTAEEGLRRFKASPPDLVLVDLMMEEVDAGTHFVKEIRAMGDKVPILMLSSVGDNLTAMTDYADLGLSGVLQKPVNPERLVSTLKSKLA